MSTETTVRTEEVTSREALQDQKTKSMDAVLEAVRHDSRRDAELYLGQCQVPHGGE